MLLFIIGMVTIVSCKPKSTEDNKQRKETKEELVNRVFKVAEKQYTDLIKKIDKNQPLLQPRSIDAEGNLWLRPYTDWTSGFFPGSLWSIYKENPSEKWKTDAIKFTEALDAAKYKTNTHDLGFMIGCSYGGAYDALKSDKYAEVLITAATSLASRFRPKAGIIQSWDTTPDMGWISKRGWDIPVIIDNMMNLDLLFRATELTKDSTYYNIAVKHAKTTLKNHFRENASSFHVVDYDSKTGTVRSKQTAQGYADDSSWARGQAWGVYGFTQTYEHTKDNAFLNQAVRIADYIMKNVKLIPYWDYNAPKIPNEPKDASAAAITASALLSLSNYVDKEQKEKMRTYAENIIRELASKKYLAEYGTNKGFILKHSVGNIHTGEEDDKPLNYADYYFLEALLKWKNLTN